MNRPQLLSFQNIGEGSIGYISVAENNKHIPFEVKRIFWTYFTPENVVRGMHAHYTTQEVLVAVAGKLIVTTESGDGDIQSFVLDRPDQGVYLPPGYWITIQYSHTAVQLAFASTVYDTGDYIRDFAEFRKKLGSKK